MSANRLGNTKGRRWIIGLVAAFSVLLTLKLGHWQLTRAWEKEALQAAIDGQVNRSPLNNAGLYEIGDSSEKLSANLHRPVELRGTWASPHTVFLDNRQMEAKLGFYVVTPLQLEGTPRTVLVQRGWVQRNFQNRSQLAAVSTPLGVVEIKARLANPPAQLYALGADGQGPIRQNIDLPSFRQETGLALLPFSVMQTASEVGNDNLLRLWPQAALGAGKNYGYAFQWFALCALIATLYVWFQFGKRYGTNRTP